jgi:hypothetical protein
MRCHSVGCRTSYVENDDCQSLGPPEPGLSLGFFSVRCGFALLWLNSFSLDPDDRATRACHRFVCAFFRHSGYLRFGYLTLQMHGATTRFLAGFCDI